MFQLMLIFGGLIGFFASIVCFVLAIAIDSGLWVNIAAGVFGFSAAQFLAFVFVKEQ